MLDQQIKEEKIGFEKTPGSRTTKNKRRTLNLSKGFEQSF